MRRTLLTIALVASIFLAGLPTAAQASDTLPIRQTCAERPAAWPWDYCVRKVKRHNLRHVRAEAKRQCREHGAPRLYCRSVVYAAEREPGVPRRWAYNADLVWLVGAESSWNHCAVNPGRHICNYRGNRAYGYGQMLRSTERRYGCRPRPSPPRAQAVCLVRYVKRRYGTPAAAKAFWQRQTPHHWY